MPVNGVTHRNLLLLASEFPPVANAGVQRPLYFAKYLPRFGWHPHVLTVKDVMHFAYDYSLLDVLPPECSVHRTESFELRRLFWLFRRLNGRSQSANTKETEKSQKATREFRLNPRWRELGRSMRGWFFVPDDRILWMPFAIWRALQLNRREKLDVIFATLPVYSSGVTAFIISKLTGVPLVIDLRDAWTGDPYAQGPTWFHRKLNRALERAAMQHAAKIIVICDDMKRFVTERYPHFSDDQVVVITNGFDRGEFDSAELIETKNKFVVVYSGALYAHHVPAFTAFCQAWSAACARDADFAQQAEFWVVGRVDPEIRQIAEEHVELKAKFLGYQLHSDAIRYLVSANLLLLLIKNLTHEAQSVITIPGKAFEYVASGAPILMIGPEGDAARIVRDVGGAVYQENSIGEIAAELSSRYYRFCQNPNASSGPTPEMLRYDRESLTRDLAIELNGVCGSGSSHIQSDASFDLAT
jgi:Glycosyl transferase 4-like domain/Glycosyl transferases group 1